jgi:hypothetical protein
MSVVYHEVPIFPSVDYRFLVLLLWNQSFGSAKLSAGAHPRRFRHTLASELPGKGATFAQIAGILADSDLTLRRRDAKWTPEYQASQDEALRLVHGTNLSHTNPQAVLAENRRGNTGGQRRLPTAFDSFVYPIRRKLPVPASLNRGAPPRQSAPTAASPLWASNEPSPGGTAMQNTMGLPVRLQGRRAAWWFQFNASGMGF